MQEENKKFEQTEHTFSWLQFLDRGILVSIVARGVVLATDRGHGSQNVEQRQNNEHACTKSQ
jgi:hypothetical protein